MTLLTDIDRAAARTERQPSAAQVASGNYRKGRVRLHGLDISIENPRGSTRRGVSPDGTPWSVTMPAHYGYVRRTEGADGDHVDVYLGTAPSSPFVWVVDQIDPDSGRFDEHKAFLGFPHREAVVECYDRAFNDDSGPARRRAITCLTVDEFKQWLADGDTTRQLARAQLFAELHKAAPRGTRSATDLIAAHLGTAWDWLEERVGDGFQAANDEIEALRAAVPRAELEEQIADTLQPLLRIFESGGEEVLNDNRPHDPGDRWLAVSFDARNRRTDAAFLAFERSLIRELAEEQEQLAREIIRRNVLAGRPPAETARELREKIGLTRLQAASVDNYRRELETLDPRALKRQLRDRRFDGPVERAIRQGDALAAEDIDRYVDRYKRRFRAHRAITIARTESLRAASLGAQAAARHLVDDGLVSPDQIERTWWSAQDARVREMHRDLHGSVVRGLDTPFLWTDPHGGAVIQIRFPHDPAAPARATVGCRCTMKVRIVRPRAV